MLGNPSLSLFPSPRYFGMSRVLLETAAVGTPVVGPRFGLMGHLIRDDRLGISTNVAEPNELARAIDDILSSERHTTEDQSSFFALLTGGIHQIRPRRGHPNCPVATRSTWVTRASGTVPASPCA